jgi:mycothiol synthase
VPVTLTSPPRLDARQRASVLELAAAIENADGAPPLSDQARSRLGSDEPRHLLAERAGTIGGPIVGYAQLDGEAAELLGEPDALEPLLDALSTASLSSAPSPAATDLVLWAHGQRSRLVPVLERRGFRLERVLWQLRWPVTALDLVPPPSGVTLRAFEVGRDEAAWLAINAAAFAHHPEQGNLTRADLAEREAEPWFDPRGFLLAERDDTGELLGFHWTKRHSPSLGEVYVLGVSPHEQGRQLGKVLLVAGLEYLRRAGVSQVLLYVDESNTAAMALYEKYGFRRHDRDAQYRRPPPR